MLMFAMEIMAGGGEEEGRMLAVEEEKKVEERDEGEANELATEAEKEEG